MAISAQHDPERTSTYRAENTWQRGDASARAQVTARQARKLSRQILSHPSLDGVPGVAEARRSLLTRVTVKSPLVRVVAPGTKAATNALGMTMFDPKEPLTTGTVIHETVHKITAHQDRNPAHGPQFRNLQAHIVRNVLGDYSAKNLEASYKRGNLNG